MGHFVLSILVILSDHATYPRDVKRWPSFRANSTVISICCLIMRSIRVRSTPCYKDAMAWTDREPDQKKRRRSTFTAQDWVIFEDYSYGKFEIPDELLPDADPVLSGFSRTDTEVDVFCKVFSRDLIEELMEGIADEDDRYSTRVNRNVDFIKVWMCCECSPYGFTHKQKDIHTALQMINIHFGLYIKRKLCSPSLKIRRPCERMIARQC